MSILMNVILLDLNYISQNYCCLKSFISLYLSNFAYYVRFFDADNLFFILIRGMNICNMSFKTNEQKEIPDEGKLGCISRG